MKAKMLKWMAGPIVLIMAVTALPLLAQTQQTQTSSGVARVSLIKGDVSMQRGESGEWIAVTVNTPLVPGDTIATGAGSRAEVQLDYSNVLRLDQNAEVKVADLTASRIQLQVAHGTADLAVFQGNQANAEVDTPNVAIEPLQEGTYRIDVRSDSLSMMTVRQGQAQISTPQGSTNLNEGQQITVEGVQNPQYRVAAAPGLDGWDYWNRNRNGVIENAQNYNHVNRYYTGAQDLGSYGRWVQVPGYDWCWTPYVDAGWVPYSYGRWVWEPFYGWTWVSYDPWGWAPYHYGRWFFWNNVWCWWPGAVTPFYRPLWAPAYVSFFGFGYGRYHFSFGYGYGFRSIGWCPLGPRDRFHPWWGRGHSFNVVNFDHHYGHGFDRGGRGFRGSNLDLLASSREVRRGLVTMPGDRFGRGAVRGNHQVVTEGMLRQADVVRGTLPVVPTRASLRVTNHSAIVPAIARTHANNTHFFSRRPVAGFSGRQHSFNRQAASIRRMVQTHNVRAAGANRGSTGVGARRSFGAQGRQAENSRGMQQRPGFSEQRGNAGRRTPAPVVRENPQQSSRNGNSGNLRSAQAGQSGWRRFGTGSVEARSRSTAGRQTRAPVFQRSPARSGQQNARGNGSAGRYQGNGNNGFRHFSAQPGPQSARRSQGGNTNFSRSAPRNNNGNSAGWNRFRPQPQAAPQRGGGGFYNRGSRGQGYSQPRFGRQPSYNQSRSYSRPPLRLNKPIVSEPRARSYGRSYGGSRPSFRGGSRGTSAPSFHGGSRGSASHGSGGRRGGGGHRR